ncbi:carboxypeptidase regulatory-like domain-containing protein [Mucilaginibacter daejeonensis]|uniref:TonB-dependent receptor n=1 Tax=Mucilaginibacter daejeonensis TaxID=398049 RepID=UPI001D170297|nr:carboxypeptidase regulatory-like domain-containing protein [Mucilaginibacter daejeonensis]UEG54665.1 carboxypeptidase regulatory-like domain-containing protein [Mucilaginibacter daejeonensis]
MRKVLLLSMMFLLATVAAFAQVTTSSLTGVLKDSKGEALVGATVKATHLPSGSNYSTATNADGRYTIANMRVGGPYRVTISYIGFETKTVNDITLTLGQPYVLNTTMAATGTVLTDVVVTGTANKLLSSNRQGTSTNISTREINTLPTITRNLNDLTRITPQATSTNNGAIGGGNSRQNQVTVDGSNFTNRFGIGSNLPASGSPISLDALQEISVNVTPFDVKQGGFIGSSVNAITRSGTNQIEGSVYTYWRNDKLQGNKVGDNTPFTKQRLQQNQTGFRIGGPIIKDKLFLFVNGEFMKQTSPGQQFVAATTANPFVIGNTANIKRPTETQLNDIRSYLQSKYGYETGPYQGYDFKSKNNKFLARLDWNINDNNKINVRYSQVESSSPSFVSTSRSPLSAFSQTRTSQYALQFANANYAQDQNLYSGALEWNSNNLFGSKVSNTLRVTYDHQNDPRSSQSSLFPFVDILQDGLPLTSFGYEPFTYGNLRDVKTTTVYDYVTLTAGKHNITAGVQGEFSRTTNGFQRFGTGYYTFASWADFVNGAKPQDFAITYPLNQGFNQAFPSFKFAQYSVYGQDDISISDRFHVTPGLRIDIPTFPGTDEIKTHPLVAGLAFNNGVRVNTGALPKSRVMFSPRVGFNYDVNGDRSVVLRGGTGIFTGQIPFVWIVSQSGDSGLLQFTQTYVGQANTPGPFNPDPTAYRPTTLPTVGGAIPSAISAMDPNLKFPQVWGSSLAVDAKLPWGVVGTLEGIYKKDINNVYGTNVNLVTPTALAISGYADTREIYPSSNGSKFVNPISSTGQPLANGTATGANAFNTIVLTNGKGGHYYNVTAKLEKTFSHGFAGMVAYSRSGAKNIFDGSGDQLINTWSLTQVVNNANTPPLSYANYVVPNRVIASVQYRQEYLKHLATTISLFYEGSITGRFSYIYSNDFNRDGQTNDLIYVPKDASEITFVPVTYGGVTYTPQQQSDAFFAYVSQDKYLSKRMGKYAERNGAQYPWRNQVDFKFLQDLFVNVGGKRNTIQFSFDVFNFGNLLNKKWGSYKLVNNSSILVPTNTSSLSANGTTKPTFQLGQDRGSLITNTFRDDVSLNSTYYMQFGLRYIFQ